MPALDRDADDAVDAGTKSGLHRSALALGVLVGQQEQKGVPGTDRLLLDLADEVVEERVGQVGNDDADRLARTEHERTRVRVGDIADPLRLRLDARPRRRVDPGHVVERTRDRVHGEPDRVGDVLQRAASKRARFPHHCRA